MLIGLVTYSSILALVSIGSTYIATHYDFMLGISLGVFVAGVFTLAVLYFVLLLSNKLKQASEA